MKTNDIIDVVILNEDFKGNGVARYNNFVIFVKGAFVNEKVRVVITKVNKRFAIGKIIEVLEKSSKRKIIKCPNFYDCGGCNYLHINTLCENKEKNEYIKNLFKDYLVKDIIYGEDNFRNKVTFHVKDNRLGYYDVSSHDFTRVSSCLLLDPLMVDLIPKIEELDLSLVNNVIIRVSYTTREVLVYFDGKVDASKLEKYCDSIYEGDNLVYGKEYIKEVIDNISYTIYPKSFFQVNTIMMKKLYDVIKSYALVGDNLLDLYCGTGTIGIYLKDNFKKITGIEINSVSIKNANLNKKINNIKNIDFICGDAKDLKNKDFDVIVVDPPRSGLMSEVVDNLLKIKTGKIIYVSCNPTTLKRDLALLSSLYEVLEITPVNMFNRTKHVECVALLKLNIRK